MGATVEPFFRRVPDPVGRSPDPVGRSHSGSLKRPGPKKQDEPRAEHSYEGVQNLLNKEGSVIMVEVPLPSCKGEQNAHVDGIPRICKKRWRKGVSYLLCFPSSPRMGYLAKQLKIGFHYSLSIVDGEDYVKAALELSLSRGCETFQGIKVLDVDKAVAITDDRMGVAWHGMSQGAFSPIDTVAIRDALLKNGTALLDTHRHNVGIDVGFVGNNNLSACKESRGVMRPLTHGGTTQEWVGDALVGTTTLLRHCQSLLKKQTGEHWPIYEDPLEDSPGSLQRSKLCAAMLVPGRPGACAIEAGKALYQCQEIKNASTKANDSTPFCWLARMWELAKKGKEYGAPKDAVLAANLNAPHSDKQNCPVWSEVFVWAETFVLEEGGKYFLVRVAFVSYAKESNLSYMRMRTLAGPIIDLAEGYVLKNASRDIVDRPAWIPENGTPRVLSAPHVNKPGITYATFSESIIEFVKHYRGDLCGGGCRFAGLGGMSPMLVIVACMILSVPPMDHCPIIFRQLILELIADPCYLGFDLRTTAPMEVGHAFYIRLFDDADDEKGFVWKAKKILGWSKLQLRKQPSQALMDLSQFQSSVGVLLRFNIELREISEDELHKNLETYYHRLAVVLGGSVAHESGDRKQLFDEFGVHGILGLGPLTVQHAIGVAAMTGFFPQVLGSQAEIPQTLGARKLFEDLPGWDEHQEEHGEYHMGQRLLRILSRIFDTAVAVQEEVVCKIKKIKLYGPEQASTKHDVVCPGVHYLEYSHDGKILRTFGVDGQEGIREECHELRVETATGVCLALSGFWDFKLKELEKHQRKRASTKVGSDQTSSFFPPEIAKIKKAIEDAASSDTSKSLSGDATVARATRSSIRIAKQVDEDCCFTLAGISSDFVLQQGEIIRVDPTGAVLKVLESDRRTREGGRTDVVSVPWSDVPRIPHKHHFHCAAMNPPWQILGREEKKKGAVVPVADFHPVSSSTAPVAMVQLDRSGSETSPSPLTSAAARAMLERAGKPIPRCVKELFSSQSLSPKAMAELAHDQTPLFDRGVKKMLSEDFVFAPPPEVRLPSKPNRQGERRKRRRANEAARRIQIAPSRKRSRCVTMKVKKTTMQKGEQYCLELHDAGTKANDDSRAAKMGRRQMEVRQPGNDGMTKSAAKFYCVSIRHVVNGKSMEFTPNPEFPLYDNNEGSSFVDPGSQRRFHCTLPQAKLYAAVSFIFANRGLFCHLPSIRELWGPSGGSQLEDIAEQQLAVKLSVKKRFKRLMLNPMSGWSAGTVATAKSKSRPDVVEGDLYPGAFESKDVESMRLLALGEHGRGLRQDLNCVQIKYRLGGLMTYFATPRFAYKRCSGLHLTRPQPCAREIEDGIKKPFDCIIGHGGGGSTPAWLLLKWHDGSQCSVPISLLVQDVPFECNVYVIENGLEHRPGFKKVARLRYGRKEVDEAVGNSVPVASIDGSNNTRETRQIRYVMPGPNLLRVHLPLDREPTSNDSTGRVSAIVPVELPVDDSIKFNQFGCTFAALGAYGCGKCRNTGCGQCYVQFLCNNTEAVSVPGGVRDDNGMDQIVGASCLTCMLAMLSVLTLNVGTVGFERDYRASSLMLDALQMLKQGDTRGCKMAVCASAPTLLLPNARIRGTLHSYLSKRNTSIDGRCLVTSVHYHTIAQMTTMKHSLSETRKCSNSRCGGAKASKGVEAEGLFLGLCPGDSVAGRDVLTCTREELCPHCEGATVAITQTVTKVHGDLFAVSAVTVEPRHANGPLAGGSHKLLNLHREVLIGGSLFTLKGAIVGKGDDHTSVTVLKDCVLVHEGADSHDGQHVLHGTALEDSYTDTLQAGKELRYVLYERAIP